MELTGLILGKNFLFEDFKAHFTTLFKDEEVNERLSLILEHRKFSINAMGEQPKILLDDWIDANDTLSQKKGWRLCHTTP